MNLTRKSKGKITFTSKRSQPRVLFLKYCRFATFLCKEAPFHTQNRALDACRLSKHICIINATIVRMNDSWLSNRFGDHMKLESCAESCCDLVAVQYISQLKQSLSVLMLCAPSNRRRPFSYHTKMADFEYFRVLSVFS